MIYHKLSWRYPQDYFHSNSTANTGNKYKAKTARKTSLHVALGSMNLLGVWLWLLFSSWKMWRSKLRSGTQEWMGTISILYLSLFFFIIKKLKLASLREKWVLSLGKWKKNKYKFKNHIILMCQLKELRNGSNSFKILCMLLILKI